MKLRIGDFVKKFGIILLIVSVVSFFGGADFSHGGSGKSADKEENKQTVYVMQKPDGKEYKRIVSQKNKLHYRGYEDEKLPVSMKVSYFLNKMPVEANDLIGESGDLIIHIEYKNNIKSGNVYVPFLAITSLVLDSDKFSNVKVYAGKVIDDGSRKIVTGFATPGMTESIGLAGSGVKFPEEVNILAKVKDFEMGEIYSYISADPFKNIDMSKVGSLDGLEAKISQMREGTSRLLKGSCQLAKGNAAIAKGAGKLTEVSKKISKMTKLLSDGNAAIKKNIPTLASSIGKLQEGSKNLADGNEGMSEGLKKLYGAAPGNSSPGSGTQALAGAAKQVQSAAKQVSGGIPKVIGSVTGNIKKITANNDEINSGTQQLVDGIISSVNKQLAAAGAGFSITEENYTAQIAAGLKSIEAGIKQCEEAIKQYEAAGQTTSEAYKAAVKKRAELMAQLGMLSGIKGQLDAIAKYHRGVKAYTGAVSQLEKGIKESKDIQTLEKGAEAVANGSGRLAEGISGVNDAIGKQMIPAAAKLADGSKKLNAGIGALQGGSMSLVRGVNKLSNGSMRLHKGMVIFSSKEAEFAKGTEKLAKGAAALSEGLGEMTKTLNAQLAKLNVRGVSKAINNAKALQNAAEQYDSFGDLHSYNNVTFVYKIDEMKK